MLTVIPGVLTADQVAHCRTVLEGAEWADGRTTAGRQSAEVKHNLQTTEGSPVARELGALLLGALGASAGFHAAALPLRVFPPMFNRYDVGMRFGAHVDNAIRFPQGSPTRVRTDLSATLSLTDPADYDGGELVVQDLYGEHTVRLNPGELVLYPASSLHRVEPITRGSRWAGVFWVQSMVRDDGRRTLIYELDRAIMDVRTRLGDAEGSVLALTATYHNLLRMWAET